MATTIFEDLSVWTDYINPESINLPFICPKCNSSLKKKEQFVCCPNPHCSQKIYGDIQKWVKVNNIAHVGDATIQFLVDQGILKDVVDLYNLSLEDFLKIPRKGEKHYIKMQNHLDFSRNLGLVEFLAGLNIEEASIGTWENIIEDGYSSLETILDMTEFQIANCQRVGWKRAPIIRQGLNDKLELIKRLQTVVNISTPTNSPIFSGSSLLGGMSFLFTGAMSVPRKEIEELVRNSGGVVAKSVNKDLDFLVTNDLESGSSKSVKAKKLGIKIITEDKFREILSSGFERP